LAISLLADAPSRTLPSSFSRRRLPRAARDGSSFLRPVDEISLWRGEGRTALASGRLATVRLRLDRPVRRTRRGGHVAAAARRAPQWNPTAATRRRRTALRPDVDDDRDAAR